MATISTTNGWLDLNEAAVYLKLSRRTLERAVADSRIPYARDPLTGRVRFRPEALDKWMVSGKRGAAR